MIAWSLCSQRLIEKNPLRLQAWLYKIRIGSEPWADLKNTDVEDDTDIQEIGVLVMKTLGGFHGKDLWCWRLGGTAGGWNGAWLVCPGYHDAGIDGLEALRALWETEAFKDTLVIFMTAKVMKDEQAKYLE